MIIRLHRTFRKRYHLFSGRLRQKVDNAIEQFQADPRHPSLRNHALAGLKHGMRAFSVTGDVRIIFIERDEYTFVLFLDVGTHAQVYGE